MCKQSEDKETGCDYCPLYLADIDCVDYEGEPTPQQQENIAANWAAYRKEHPEEATV